MAHFIDLAGRWFTMIYPRVNTSIDVKNPSFADHCPKPLEFSTCLVVSLWVFISFIKKWWFVPRRWGQRASEMALLWVGSEWRRPGLPWGVYGLLDQALWLGGAPVVSRSVMGVHCVYRNRNFNEIYDIYIYGNMTGHGFLTHDSSTDWFSDDGVAETCQGPGRTASLKNIILSESRESRNCRIPAMYLISGGVDKDSFPKMDFLL